MPRSISYIFQRIDALTAEADDVQYTVRISVLEIYNESLHDLLAADLAEPAVELGIFEDKKGKLDKLAPIYYK